MTVNVLNSLSEFPGITTVVDLTIADFGEAQSAVLFYTNDPTADFDPVSGASVQGLGFINRTGPSTAEVRSSVIAAGITGGFASNTYNYNSSDSLIFLEASSSSVGSIAGYGTAVPITDGFRVTFTWNSGYAPGVGQQLAFQLFGDDSDITSAMGEVTSENGSVNETVGFTPDVVFFATTRIATQTGTSGKAVVDGALSFGVATRDPVDATIKQSSINHLFVNKTAFPSECSGVASHDSVVRSMSSSLELGGMQVNGFGGTSFNVGPIPGLSGGVISNYLALNFGSRINLYHHQLQAPLSNSTDYQVINFEPSNTVMAFSRIETINTLSTDGQAGSFGMGFSVPRGGNGGKGSANVTFGDNQFSPQRTTGFMWPYHSIFLRHHSAAGPELRVRCGTYVAGLLPFVYQATGEASVGFGVSFGLDGTYPITGQSVAANLLDPSNFTPYADVTAVAAVAPGQDAVAAFIAGTHDLFLPTVLAAVVAEPELLDPAATVFPPTTAPDQEAHAPPMGITDNTPFPCEAATDQVVTPIFLVDPESLPFVAGAAEDQVVAPDTIITPGPALFAITDVTTDLKALPELVEGGEVFSPTAVANQVVAPEFLDPVSSTFDPTANRDQVVVPVFLDPLSIPANPSVSLNVIAVVDLLDPASSVFACEAHEDQVVAPEFLDPGSSVFSPAAAEDQEVAAAFLDPTSTVFSPTADIQVTAVVDDMVSGGEVYLPSVDPDQTTAPGLLDPGSGPYLPTVSVEGGAVSPGDLSALDKKIQVILAKVLRRRE